MTAADWAAFAISICTLIGTFALMIKWMVKHYLNELRPNGGSSVKDKIDRLELRVDEIYRLLVNK